MSRSRHLVMPEAHAVLDTFGSALNAENVAGLRAMMKAMIESMPPPADDGVKIEERRIPGPAGAPQVRVLVYTPPGLAGPLPVHLDIHGGGYIAGSADIDGVLCRQMCVAVGCVVVSVDYRLAPEVRYPGALEDCYAALQWVHREGAALGFDMTRIRCGGESAGGGHCAAMAILLRDRGGPKILLQLLGQPMLDDRTGSTSEPHPYTGEFVWTPTSIASAGRSLLGVEAGSRSGTGAGGPGSRQGFSGLPPCIHRCRCARSVRGGGHRICPAPDARRCADRVARSARRLPRFGFDRARRVGVGRLFQSAVRGLEARLRSHADR